MKRLLIVALFAAGCGLDIDGRWAGNYTYVYPSGYAEGGTLNITAEKGDFAGNGRSSSADAGWQVVGQYDAQGKAKLVFQWPGLGPVNGEGEVDLLNKHLVGTFTMTAGTARAGSCSIDLRRN